jgi:magnesium-transporting ATPase (P-type)
MAYRRYRKRRSTASQILSDTTFIANRLSWKACIFLGIFSFSLFYFLIPVWINSQLNTLQGNMFRPVVEVIFARRTHWVKWVGIALGLICAFFAFRNYFVTERISSYGERNVSFFSHLLAKFLD